MTHGSGLKPHFKSTESIRDDVTDPTGSTEQGHLYQVARSATQTRRTATCRRGHAGFIMLTMVSSRAMTIRMDWTLMFMG